MRDSTLVEGGSAVAINGKPVGRVASSRLSPYTGKCIGLAWVPMAIAVDSIPLQIRVNGRMAVADVVSAPFYDPEGKRLRV